MPKWLALAMLCLALSGCRGDDQIATPREPGPGATGYYCRMTLGEHTGPKGQILPRGWQDPLWFSSVRDALTYVEQDLVSDREMAGFWVNDMAQGTWEAPAPGSWIDARSATYVIGSTKNSAMGGSEAVPFKERAAAETFVKAHGGHLADYLTARRNVAEAPVPELPERGGT
ncbi:MAG: nitrous oxide reductase accessory protein NosL [Hyphomicrobium sp.]